MNLCELRSGDRVECRLNGLTFAATYLRRTPEGLAEVDPTYPWAHRHRRLEPRRVIRKLRPA